MNNNSEKNPYTDASFNKYKDKIGASFKFSSPTAENTDVFIRRIVAYLLDMVITSILPIIIFSIILIWKIDSMSETAFLTFVLVFVIVFMILVMLYYFIMEAYMKGTLGKKICGLELVDFEGNRIGFVKWFLRTILKSIASYAFYIPQILSLFQKRNQTLYDALSLTIVRRK